MKSIANHDERALDDALGMTFPASDPVAVFIPDAPAQMRIETNPPVPPHPGRARRKVCAPGIDPTPQCDSQGRL